MWLLIDRNFIIQCITVVVFFRQIITLKYYNVIISTLKLETEYQKS